jgi:hypothetical protein
MKRTIPIPTKPEEFCWIYAVGCLGSRRDAHTLSNNEFDQAMKYITCKEYPPAHLIREWFPKPFTILEKNGQVCALEAMQEYWRVDHLEFSQESPSYLTRIKNVNILSRSFEPTFVHAHSIKKLPREERVLIAENIHGYELYSNDLVYIHGHVVAEKVSP